MTGAKNICFLGCRGGQRGRIDYIVKLLFYQKTVSFNFLLACLSYQCDPFSWLPTSAAEWWQEMTNDSYQLKYWPSEYLLLCLVSNSDAVSPLCAWYIPTEYQSCVLSMAMIRNFLQTAIKVVSWWGHISCIR
jgi:hypothetical protein